ncbi:39S ribosomal protein L22, mitochondrial [Ophidiomyces ophidiicola]|nr:39S ribosomal protein L22, mitochondrial [Ophidiomyces ophidiicola]KAI1976099.1 39S ribosomal protein L22, mitochondrial [Ophidiomyces ophidiicola]KAI1986766.1 39S ribosomal protein L22, mitochondrial [Ophidiomyces ophidiicola]KAI1991702.1 39S ribosomal protein L22, mitochondrial [Ophidiomyces ophidiicola]
MAAAALACRPLARATAVAERWSAVRRHLLPICRRTFAAAPPLHAAEPLRPPPVKRGSLASGSIFADGEDFPKTSTEGRVPRRRAQPVPDTGDAASLNVPLVERDSQHLDRALNPFPNRRARWHRKMVIRSVRRCGRLTAKEQIMQSERESSSKSHFFKTSLKKLGPLARQIAGKNIDDAILQMRFSKKKAAKDVKAFLEHAKNEVIVSRGMGLGQLPIPSETSEQSDQSDASNKPDASTTPTSTPTNTVSPVHLRLKDGTRHTVADPTSIYISQAWVGRGPFGKELSHRGRGNIHILRPPHTSVSVVLKEEKTRIREWREREEKLIRQRRTKVWRQLPDRKVTMRNQFYAW